MDQFWPDLLLPKAKIKMPWATAECDKIPKMGKIICFYVNTYPCFKEWGRLFCDFHLGLTPDLLHYIPSHKTLFQMFWKLSWMSTAWKYSGSIDLNSHDPFLWIKIKTFQLPWRYWVFMLQSFYYFYSLQLTS